MHVLALIFALAAQPVPVAPPVVSVIVDGKTIDVDEKAWATLKTVDVAGTEKDGSKHTYSGVTLASLLDANGVAMGEKLRGEALAAVIIVEAVDGYRVAFGVGDIDPTLTQRTVLLARTRDGQPLALKNGPLQLIVPGDTRPSRWVRQVMRIRILTL